MSDHSIHIAQVRSVTVGVTSRTNWVHVVVTDTDGVSGVGEATLDGFEEMVEARVRQLARRLERTTVSSISSVVSDIGVEDTPAGLINAAAVSGVEQALWDLLGRKVGASVTTLLGAPGQRRLRLYANVNRALLADRSPTAFADMARRAVDDGFSAIKCAPFDSVRRADLADRSVRQLVDEGLARIAAVRSAIGDDVDLAIDCHYRFTSRSAPGVIDAIAAFDPFWVEAPVAEHRLDEWAEIRAATNVRLAGGEMMTGLIRFSRFIEASGVDVVMPDIKYVGGVSGLRAIAAIAESRGVLVAPHNPSGPVATLAAHHAAAELRNAFILEWAFGECSWRSELVSGAERVRDGWLEPTEGGGFGGTLDEPTLAAHPAGPVRDLDLRLYG